MGLVDHVDLLLELQDLLLRGVKLRLLTGTLLFGFVFLIFHLPLRLSLCRLAFL